LYWNNSLERKPSLPFFVLAFFLASSTDLVFRAIFLWFFRTNQ
jgi:hypothetical protein